jgi:hypothetical protein
MVIRPEGTPAEGVPVRSFRGIGESGMSTQDSQTETDAQGRFRFEGLLPGNQYYVEAGKDKPSVLITSSNQSEKVTIPSGGTVELKPIRPKSL